jgi:hypothetical protein
MRLICRPSQGTVAAQASSRRTPGEPSKENVAIAPPRGLLHRRNGCGTGQHSTGLVVPSSRLQLPVQPHQMLLQFRRR